MGGGGNVEGGRGEKGIHSNMLSRVHSQFDNPW